MEYENIKLWSNLTFKTRSYRKNFDLVTENENIITEYEGSVSELRIGEGKRPFIIGEYGFSVWNIGLAKLLNIDLNEILKAYSIENAYSELKQAVDSEEITLHKYKKVVLIHSFIVRADYRKRGVTEEFIEAMYRDFYDDETTIIMLTKPLQYNQIDDDYYRNHKFVTLLNNISDIDEAERIPAYEYYSLNDLYVKNDIEYNELKLFAVADRCGFVRIDETHLFLFIPDKTVVRMLMKMKKIKQLKH